MQQAPVTDADFERILEQAHAAATAAQAGMVENMNAMDCGFAWVTTGGNSGLARYCRRQLKAREFGDEPTVRDYRLGKHFGSKGYPKGWQWWKPGSFNGQSVGIHLAGATAFAKVLNDNTVSCTVGSRLD